MKQPKFDNDSIEIWGNAEPMCPWCGHKLESCDFEIEPEDGLTTDIYCTNCDEKYQVEVSVEIKYHSSVDQEEK